MTVLRLAPGVDWLSIDDILLVRSGRGTVRLEGELGEFARGRLLPALADGAARSALAGDLPDDTVDRVIAQLIRAGVVIEERAGGEPTAAWTHLVIGSLKERGAVAARAARARV